MRRRAAKLGVDFAVSISIWERAFENAARREAAGQHHRSHRGAAAAIGDGDECAPGESAGGYPDGTAGSSHLVPLLQLFDSEFGAAFFQDLVTGAASWELPPGGRIVWHECWDDDRQCSFYANVEARTTQWQCPAPDAAWAAAWAKARQATEDATADAAGAEAGQGARQGAWTEHWSHAHGRPDCRLG